MAKKTYWGLIAVAAATVTVSAAALSCTSRANASPADVLIYASPT